MTAAPEIHGTCDPRFAPVRDALANNYYHRWLYVAVSNTDGTFHGFYMTKDRGLNWTRVKLTGSGGFSDAVPPAGYFPYRDRSRTAPTCGIPRLLEDTPTRKIGAAGGPLPQRANHTICGTSARFAD